MRVVIVAPSLNPSSRGSHHSQIPARSDGVNGAELGETLDDGLTDGLTDELGLREADALAEGLTDADDEDDGDTLRLALELGD